MTLQGGKVGQEISGTVDLSDLMEDVFSGTPILNSGTDKKAGWRLDFTQDSATAIRARLRRGRGKNRNNVKDASGTVIIRNYVALGSIEEIENDPKYRQWHARCKAYREHIARGERMGVDSGTPKNGVAQHEGNSNPLLDLDRQEKWQEIRGGVLGVCH